MMSSLFLGFGKGEHSDGGRGGLTKKVVYSVMSENDMNELVFGAW